MADLLSTEAIEAELPKLSGWGYSDGALRRTVERKGFLGALTVLNAIAYLANEAKHHPDLTLHGYNQVSITLTTHAAGGVTENDILLARRISDLVG